MNDHDHDNRVFDRRYWHLRRRARWSGYMRIAFYVVVVLFLLWLVWLGVAWGMV